MEEHERNVSVIASQVRQFHQKQTPFRIYHGHTNSTRRPHYPKDQIIDTSNLSHILNINIDKKTLLVEPNVPMDRMVEDTLEFGLIPQVVMEFPGITVGGGFSGTAGESSSFRHGLFEHTVNCIEIVLPNGEIVTASATEKQELFCGAASAFGTLGVITLLEVQLMQAKSYVELTYVQFESISAAIAKIEQATNDLSIEYLDAIMFTRNSGLLFIGRLIDAPVDGMKVQHFSRRGDPWFYLHAQQILAANAPEPVTEAIPLTDYLFRYDRGAFWAGMYAFRYFITPFNRITRWILDKYMHTRVMYRALHQSGLANRYIVQDVGVPYSAAAEFLDYLDNTVGFYPIWLCPVSLRRETSYSLMGGDGPGRLLNFGIWGPGPNDLDNFVQVNRILEHKVHSLQGKKCLYAHAYYMEEEFWNIYDRQKYDALRAKYHATYLPSIYEKTRSIDVEIRRKEIKESWISWAVDRFWRIWPLTGLYGVLHAVLGGEYILPSKPLRYPEKCES